MRPIGPGSWEYPRALCGRPSGTWRPWDWWRRCPSSSRVRTLTEKDVRDNYSVRICLESKSIRDAISQLDDQQLAALVEQLLAGFGALKPVYDLMYQVRPERAPDAGEAGLRRIMDAPDADDDL